MDHELLPAFAVGVNYTYRKFKDQLFHSRTGLTRYDYVPVSSVTRPMPKTARTPTARHRDDPDGCSYALPVFQIADGRSPGILPHEPLGYEQTYSGVDLTLNKRLSNRWLARGSFSYNLNKQQVGSGGCVDPTNVVPGQSANLLDPQAGYAGQSCEDDEFVGVRSVGSGRRTASS